MLNFSSSEIVFDYVTEKKMTSYLQITNQQNQKISFKV